MNAGPNFPKQYNDKIEKLRLLIKLSGRKIDIAFYPDRGWVSKGVFNPQQWVLWCDNDDDDWKHMVAFTKILLYEKRNIENCWS